MSNYTQDWHSAMREYDRNPHAASAAAKLDAAYARYVKASRADVKAWMRAGAWSPMGDTTHAPESL